MNNSRSCQIINWIIIFPYWKFQSPLNTTRLLNHHLIKSYKTNLPRKFSYNSYFIQIEIIAIVRLGQHWRITKGDWISRCLKSSHSFSYLLRANKRTWWTRCAGRCNTSITISASHSFVQAIIKLISPIVSD